MEHLIGSIQKYVWGDPSMLAELQGRSPSGEPEAELWLGAHAVAPSRLGDSKRSLIDVIEARPESVLGPLVLQRFGRLPYLLKVLSAARPLSIQVHPSQAQAQAGFARDEMKGLAVDSPNRSYRDDNHKPELICALTNFEAKCGFRPIDETALLFDVLHAAVPSAGLLRLCQKLSAGGEPRVRLGDILDWLLRLPAADAESVIGDVLRAADQVLTGPAASTEALRFEPDLRWLAELERFYPTDPGIVVSLLLNHVVLEPGQAVFLGAGNLHSYLRGAGVELMANSDNVIRGGLTTKYVDVDELLNVVDTTPSVASVQTPTESPHRFDSAVPEFSLTRFTSDTPTEITPAGPEILLVTQGSAHLEAVEADTAIELAKGESGFVAWSDGPYRIVPGPHATVWRAAVGDLLLS